MLRRPSKKVLINSFDSDTIVIVDGTIFIKGFGHFKASDVVACSKVCAAEGTAKVTRLRVIIADSCECPETYDVMVVAEPNLQEYEVDSTFPVEYLKTHESPTGGSFTAAQAAAGLVEQINLDKSIPVTAVQTDAAGNPDAAGEYITLTQKANAPEYNAYNPGGTVTVVTPYVAPILPLRTLQKIFPIQFGHFGSNPNLPKCGDYCKYYLKIVNCCATESDSYDVSMDRAVQGHDQEVEFYVNKDAAGFQAFWDDLLVAQLPCLNPGSSGGSSGIIVT